MCDRVKCQQAIIYLRKDASYDHFQVPLFPKPNFPGGSIIFLGKW